VAVAVSVKTTFCVPAAAAAFSVGVAVTGERRTGISTTGMRVMGELDLLSARRGDSMRCRFVGETVPGVLVLVLVWRWENSRSVSSRWPSLLE